MNPDKLGPNTEGYVWDDFKDLSLKRGWKICVGYLSPYGFGEITMHYQTVKEDGKTGKDALTYAGNSTRYYNFFRHETANDYFNNVIKEIDDQIKDIRVWVLKQKE